ncbi:hypothetical protein RHSIM_Rhsim09G0141300 [Rhododendron simsii]|uniref:Uncharacterized protein n=1 Tax=Rhododendron simsii TaxID=118357 RepID=A0A834GFN8_RHOSS|nr:hypothetical protein RHSIM_Rhsim09G0141300 [Rhododendron simsii]
MIQESLGRSYSVPDDIDEEELMGELDALEADMGMQTEELNLPSAPSGHAVPAGRANPQHGGAMIQESLGSSYSVPDDIDEEELMERTQKISFDLLVSCFKLKLDALEADMGMQTDRSIGESHLHLQPDKVSDLDASILNLAFSTIKGMQYRLAEQTQQGSGEVVRPKSVYGEVVGTLLRNPVAADRRWPLQSQFEIVERADVSGRCSEPAVDNPARQQRDNKQINKKEQSSHDLQGNNNITD